MDLNKNMWNLPLDVSPTEKIVALTHWILPINRVKAHLIFLLLGGGTLSSLDPGPRGHQTLNGLLRHHRTSARGPILYMFH